MIPSTSTPILPFWRLLKTAAILSFFSLSSPVAPQAAAEEFHSLLPSRVYLFSYFKEPNGKDGLHLAWSQDGLKWTPLNNDQSFLPPTLKGNLMRDPCVAQGPDGTFHVVWTTGWNGKTIGYASTKDFKTWSPQKEIPVMDKEPTTKNAWAPEVAYDAKRRQFLIFWASTVDGKFMETWFDGKNHNNHRIYATTTADFQTFSPTKLFFDPGFNCIDSTILQRDGKNYMIFKDETNFPRPMKNLRVAVADDLQGPYRLAPEPISPKNLRVEGPTALKIGEWTYVYYDCFQNGHFGVIRSRDWKTWEDVTPQLSMPKGIRHGTAFEVPSRLVSDLMAKKP